MKLNELNKQVKIASFIPGIFFNGYKDDIKTQIRREIEQIKKDDKNKGSKPEAHAIAERIGGLTSPMFVGASGAALGALISGLSRRNAAGGALVGGATGFGVSAIAKISAALAAAIKRRRTAQEQIDADKESVLAKYLVPGVSTYGLMKRIGRSKEETEELSNSEKKAQDMGSMWNDALKWAKKNVGDPALAWYHGLDDDRKALVRGLGATLGSAAIGGLVGGRKGALGGALAGGLASSIDWGKVRRSIDAEAAKSAKVRALAMAGVGR